jgi:tripartite-type tricarboxylate transporter receptor subunit TctC
VLPHVKAGKLVALGVSGGHRSPTLPDVPTMAEAGVKGYEANFTLVLFAMRGTPPAIVERMRLAVVDAMQASDVAERLKASDQMAVGSTTEQAMATLVADSKKWGEVARRIKLGLD